MGVFTEGLVIPDGQGAGDFEPVHGFAVLGAELVGGFVAFDAQGVKQTDDIAIQLDLAAQLVEQVGLGGGGLEVDPGPAGQILGQGLAQLAQFDQGGVGIAGEYLLGRARKL
ncbi:hypothetical protein D3C85_1664380 [compost metagenome]